jgi:hypothetical protein
MQSADRIDAEIRLLAADLDRTEAEQARGVDVLADLEAVVDRWRELWLEAASVGYLELPHGALRERFRCQAQVAPRPWEA